MHEYKVAIYKSLGEVVCSQDGLCLQDLLYANLDCMPQCNMIGAIMYYY